MVRMSLSAYVVINCYAANHAERLHSMIGHISPELFEVTKSCLAGRPFFRGGIITINIQ
jgi:hypothetical protein